MRPEALARAIELDDDYPDNVCPGCQQDIAGWERFEAHYLPGTELSERGVYGRERAGLPWPFVPISGGYRQSDKCPWILDYLVARRFRRRFIAKHFKVAS